MNQSLDKNNNILQMVCESTKCLHGIQSPHPVTNTTYKISAPRRQSGPMCGRKQISTSDTIVVTRNLATKILMQYQKITDRRSLPNPTTIIRRQIPTARCLTYRFEKSVAEQIWEQASKARCMTKWVSRSAVQLARISAAKFQRETISYVTCARPHETTRLPTDGFLWNLSIFRKSVD